jgi:hypothetical protein
LVIKDPPSVHRTVDNRNTTLQGTVRQQRVSVMRTQFSTNIARVFIPSTST